MPQPSRPLAAFAAAAWLALLAASAHAADLDAGLVGRLTGLKPTVQDGVVRVAVPRDDLQVTADGVDMQAFQGLTSWAAFQPCPAGAMVMGDIVLTENEVNTTISAALASGLEVTALHNHFFFEEPRVYFLHIGGEGDLTRLAEAVKHTLSAREAAPKYTARGFRGPPIEGDSEIDPEPLQAILGGEPVVKDGMVKFTFGRTTTMHGLEVGAAMGVNTWAVFAGRAQAAVVDGDFAMTENELQPVLRALRAAGINIVAIHNHMTHEEPRLVFLHYWARGSAAELARGLKSALDAQKR